MSFLRIPESNLASTMGGQLGKAVGSVLSTAEKSVFSSRDELQSTVNSYYEDVDNVNSRIASYNVEISSGNKTAEDLIQEKKDIESAKQSLEKQKDDFNRKLDEISAKLDSIEKQMTKVSSLVTSIKKLVKTIQVPVKALKTVVTVLKALPLPQRYLVVSVTVLYSDLLEMTLELIKQVDELSNALGSVSELLPAQLDGVKTTISELRTWIAGLRLSAIFTDLKEEDRKILEEAGIVDTKTGESILSKIGKIGGSESSAFIAFGICSDSYTGFEDCEKSEKLKRATKTTLFKNLLAKAKPGDKIVVPDGQTGDYTVVMYGSGSIGGSVSEMLKKGWFFSSEEVATKPIYRTKATFSGQTNNIKVPWSEPEECRESTMERAGFLECESPSITITVLEEKDKISNLQNRDGVLKVGSVQDLLSKVATDLEFLPLSKELRARIASLVSSLQVSRTVNLTNLNTVSYIASNGERYTIEILDDQQYSRLAPRHYAAVRDSSGVVVLEGPKTFSLDVDILVTDIVNRLEQTIG